MLKEFFVLNYSNMKTIKLILFIICFAQLANAQVTPSPVLPNENKPVTITFDASQGNAGLKDYTGDIYAHTGVITDKSTSSSDWKYVIAPWTTNLPKAKLSRVSANIYTLEISPDIRSFYEILPGERILQMAFVFRSGDRTREGKAVGNKDIFVNVYSDGLNISIGTPSRINIFEKNENFTFTATTTLQADIKIFLNNQEIAAQTGTSISKSITIPDAGNYWVKVNATQNTTIKKDSVYVCIRESATNAPKPAGLPTGINYNDEKSATLIIYAPAKKHIFVTGDFNNWLPSNSFQMKKDGDFYWLKIENLIPKKEYAFQYLIDGTLKVADIYSEKISDPYDDKFIPATVYPNLIPYPAGKAVDRASVLQTEQETYKWETPTYTIPPKNKLSIYELLIRDFTTEKTYKAVQEKLPYLKRLGVNTIEFMPFNEFEGNNSWGYNPNFYFAPDKAYGTKDDLKKLIDECHKQGFIVIQDIVLNHSYNSNPMLKMYWNDALNRPAANNPWFNETSPNQVYSWGSDFNHESQATRDFVDRVNKYWLTEYKVDGFRFDFTKGFTNTPGEGSNYDASRIAILKRMADKIWEVNPDALIILEHFAANTEEKELAEYKNGMLIWGNSNYNFSEAAMGYNDAGKSDFSRASYRQRGYNKPGLVAYMESHDEERQLFKTVNHGNSFGTYNTKDIQTAIDRSRLATTFFLSLPGPKMIWQFGELGYDISIDQNGRLGEKPVLWNYLDDPKRQKLFDVYSAMLRLREQYDVFSLGNENLSLSGTSKRIQLSYNNHNINLLGNFGLVELPVTANFQHTGIWYEFFSGKELNVSDISTAVLLKPGEFHLYSDKKLPEFKSLATNSFQKITIDNELRVYPNPASDFLIIESRGNMEFVEVYNSNGKLLSRINPQANSSIININNLNSGIYFIKVRADNKLCTHKFVIK